MMLDLMVAETEDLLTRSTPQNKLNRRRAGWLLLVLPVVIPVGSGREHRALDDVSYTLRPQANPRVERTDEVRRVAQRQQDPAAVERARSPPRVGREGSPVVYGVCTGTYVVAPSGRRTRDVTPSGWNTGAARGRASRSGRCAGPPSRCRGRRRCRRQPDRAVALGRLGRRGW